MTDPQGDRHASFTLGICYSDDIANTNCRKVHATGSTGEIHGDGTAMEKFLQRFPSGYQRIPTSGEQNLCGLRALIGSMDAQGFARVPTLSDLQDIATSTPMVEFEQEICGALDAPRSLNDSFYVDQLAAIIRLWGDLHDMDLQLGYVLQGGDVFLVPGPTTTETRTIWIVSSSTSGREADFLDHYEGIAPASDVAPSLSRSHRHAKRRSHSPDQTQAKRLRTCQSTSRSVTPPGATKIPMPWLDRPRTPTLPYAAGPFSQGPPDPLTRTEEVQAIPVPFPAPAPTTPQLARLAKRDGDLYDRAWRALLSACESFVQDAPSHQNPFQYRPCPPNYTDAPDFSQYDIDGLMQKLRGPSFHKVVHVGEYLLWADAIKDLFCAAYRKWRPRPFPSTRPWNIMARIKEKVSGLPPGNERYTRYFQDHSLEELVRRLLSESEVASLLFSGEHGCREALEARARDAIEHRGPGWYLGLMTRPEDVDFWMKYVGQSNKEKGGVRTRTTEHKNAANNKYRNTMLYHFWKLQKTRTMRWILLGRLGGHDESAEDRQTWFNIVEMFYALAFQTLTEKDLESWLPQSDLLQQPHRGLNVRLPLYQGQTVSHGWTFGLQNVLRSNDPEQVKWASSRIKEIGDKGRENAWQSQNQHTSDWTAPLQWKQLSHTMFARYGRTDIIREWQEGDPENIPIICSNCKDPRSIRIDSHPKFEISSGKYVAMAQHCLVCPPGREFNIF
ncbi:hypothetical protein GQ53DRAFT_842260 [Thozetella sp. PMI_491]|nr:hypothetical protein GQ53DRAFT_842260 [Thozetella sp. PMI_491]